MVILGAVFVYADTDSFKACRISDCDIMQWDDLSATYQRILDKSVENVSESWVNSIYGKEHTEA